MGLLFKLGLRSISRNRMRSFFTISAVMLCAGGLTGFSVLFGGSSKMMLDGITGMYGHVRIVHPKVAKNERLNQGFYFVDKLDVVLKKVKSTPGVEAVYPRIPTGAYIDHTFTVAEEQKALAAKQCVHTTAKDSEGTTKSAPSVQKVLTKASGAKKIIKQSPSSGFGMDPSVETRDNFVHQKIVLGRMIRKKGKEIVIGQLLAKRLHACVGSKLTLVGKTVDDSVSAVALKVVGIFSMGGSSLDKTFYMSLDTAQFYMDLPNQASTLMVYGKDIWSAKKLAKRLQQNSYPVNVSFQPWTEAPIAKISVPLIRVFLFVFAAIVIFVGGIGLLNTMMMSVLERRKEVGIMMALGLNPSRVASVFLIESAMVGLLGAVLGVGLACLASIPLITKGIQLGSSASKIAFPISTTIKGVLTLEGVLMGLLVGVLATVVGALWPSFRASRMNPVDVLRK